LLLARELRAETPVVGQQVRGIEEQGEVAPPPRREKDRRLQDVAIRLHPCIAIIGILEERSISESLIRVEVERRQPGEAVPRGRGRRLLRGQRNGDSEQQ
jgi:hypothetical protein